MCWKLWHEGKVPYEDAKPPAGRSKVGFKGAKIDPEDERENERAGDVGEYEWLALWVSTNGHPMHTPCHTHLRGNFHHANTFRAATTSFHF